MSNKVVLSDADWDLLLMRKEFKLGNTALYLQPLGIEQLSIALMKLEGIIKTVKPHVPPEFNIKIKNMSVIEVIETVLPIIAVVVETDIAPLLSELSGLSLDDCKRLPVNIGMDLFRACLDINVSSQKGLEKNFTSLVNSLTELIGTPDTTSVQ